MATVGIKELKFETLSILAERPARVPIMSVVQYVDDVAATCWL